MQQVDATKHNPNALNQLQRLERQLSSALPEAFVLSVAAQSEIREAMEKGACATNLEDSLAASRHLYSVIAAWGERLNAQ